jgi:D-alanyl-D-alanine endopeptidase (penicillin-binding protein 7)
MVTVKHLLLILFLTPLLLSAKTISPPKKPAVTGAYGVFDVTANEFNLEENVTDVKSIASITKLFTAATVLRSGVDMYELVKVQGRSGGRFAKGSFVPRIDLFKAMLISSDNLASESLAMSHPNGYMGFIEDVERTVEHAGLENTRIVDSTGLLADNKSTVKDLSKFLIYLQGYPLVLSVASEKEDQVKYHPPKSKKSITVFLKNTNPSMWVYDTIVMSKTGFTNAAGRCVAMLMRRGSDIVVVVILGQRDLKTRTATVNNLVARM